jgi:hypothetical protein
MHLGVLRVLIEQTLEINSVVKYPTQPDPSLVTEVKDSSLTILHQIYLVQEPLWRQGVLLEGFYRAKVHPS